MNPKKKYRGGNIIPKPIQGQYWKDDDDHYVKILTQLGVERRQFKVLDSNFDTNSNDRDYFWYVPFKDVKKANEGNWKIVEEKDIPNEIKLKFEKGQKLYNEQRLASSQNKSATVSPQVQSPGQTPAQTPAQTPVQTPAQTPPQTPAQTPEVTPEPVTVDTKQGLQSVIKTVVDTILENKQIEEDKTKAAAAELAAAELAAKEAQEAAEKAAAEEAKAKAEKEAAEAAANAKAAADAAEAEAKAKAEKEAAEAAAKAAAAEAEQLRLLQEEQAKNNIDKLETTIQLKIEKNSIHIFNDIYFKITKTSETKGTEFTNQDLKATIENVINPVKLNASAILSPYHQVYYGTNPAPASNPIQIKFYIYFTPDNKLYFHVDDIIQLRGLPTTTSVPIKKGENYELKITSDNDELLNKIEQALKSKNVSLGGKNKKTKKRKQRRTKKRSSRKTRR